MAVRTRREEYRESLRQDILDAAREMFVREGYEATSVRRIAEKCSCSPGILYHYFDDKAAIMAQLVRETFVKLTHRMHAIAEDADASALDRLRRICLTYIAFGIENPHHYGVLFATSYPGHEKPKVIAAAFEEEGFRTFNCLQHTVLACISDGLLRPELTDEKEVSQAIWAALHGMASVFMDCHGFPFIEQSRLIGRHVDILIEGVRA
ncbi:MAG: TetR/AcrR family transcriptional regulator [Bryobacteraceae bacterium]|nr:TetR/AcrR family transcriptional regulator [Bryobacteraceae bacterium]